MQSLSVWGKAWQTISHCLKKLQAQLQVFTEDAYALLVYEEAVDDRFVIDLTQGEDEETFLALLEEVEKYTCLQDKIKYLRSQKISAYDLIDLLENAVFMNEEYDAYYEQMSLKEIAVLLKLLHPTGGNFHEAWKLDDADLSEIEQEQEWQSRFIHHIRQRSQKEREMLCELLNKLRIRS